MLEQADGSQMDYAAADSSHRTASYRVNRKIWLPKLVYDALPFFYLFSGITAFAATIYIGAWYWVVPHYVLFFRRLSASVTRRFAAQTQSAARWRV